MVSATLYCQPNEEEAWAMTTLARYSSNLVGFFSYSREDDADFDDVLSKFRVAIQAELSAQLGRNRDNFRIWQDKFAIPHGALWQQQITDGIKQSTFYIPIITPRVVNSPHCAFEFNSFLAREKELGRDDLVFPILYISVPELDGTWQENPVLKIVQERQYLDWRDYRPASLMNLRYGRRSSNSAKTYQMHCASPGRAQKNKSTWLRLSAQTVRGAFAFGSCAMPSGDPGAVSHLSCCLTTASKGSGSGPRALLCA